MTDPRIEWLMQALPDAAAQLAKITCEDLLSVYYTGDDPITLAEAAPSVTLIYVQKTTGLSVKVTLSISEPDKPDEKTEDPQVKRGADSWTFNFKDFTSDKPE